MENSKMSFRDWYIAIHLMSSTQTPISASEAQRQIGHKFYEPIWALMHKIRRGMGNLVEGELQFSDCDQLFTKFQTFPKGLEPSEIAFEQTVGPAAVVILVPTGNSTARPQNRKQLGMALRSDHALKSNGKQKKGRSTKKRNRKLVKILDIPAARTLKRKSNLSKIHLIVHHLKTIIRGVHCGVSRTYLQNYLNEFCFKYGQLKCLFNSILACTTIHWSS